MLPPKCVIWVATAQTVARADKRINSFAHVGSHAATRQNATEWNVVTSTPISSPTAPSSAPSPSPSAFPSATPTRLAYGDSFDNAFCAPHGTYPISNRPNLVSYIDKSTDFVDSIQCYDRETGLRGDGVDNCGLCFDGETGVAANTTMDCNGQCSGDAFVDECGDCVGGTTGLKRDHAQNCNVVCGGSAMVNDCGQCVSPGKMGHSDTSACEPFFNGRNAGRRARR